MKLAELARVLGLSIAWLLLPIGATVFVFIMANMTKPTALAEVGLHVLFWGSLITTPIVAGSVHRSSAIGASVLAMELALCGVWYLIHVVAVIANGGMGGVW
jgi:hypothetical protein